MQWLEKAFFFTKYRYFFSVYKKFFFICSMKKKRNTEIADEGVSSLAGFLKRKTSLKAITLAFYAVWGRPGVTDIGLSRLAEALKKQTCLKSVNLEFTR